MRTVKIKTWDEMEDESCTYESGYIAVPGMYFTREMEECLPEDRVITLDERDMWHPAPFRHYFIDDNMIDREMPAKIDEIADLSAIDAKDDSLLIFEGKDPKSRYYDAGGIEVLDVIEAKLTPEQFKGYMLGNIIKYSCRANFKGSLERDIEKIGYYASKLIAINKEQ